MNKIPAIAHTFGNSKQDFNRHPQSNTLISLNDLGEPLSYFGDLIWDLSCYAIRANLRLKLLKYIIIIA